MTLQNLISDIPTMNQTDFHQLAKAVLSRLYKDEPSFRPLTEEEWEKRLNHAIAQADRGDLHDAHAVSARIRAEC